MAISVTEPISRAIERTKLILFKPFKLEKWFVLGFCAFLTTLEGGGGANGGCSGNPFGFGGPGGGRRRVGPGLAPPRVAPLDQALTWLSDNAAWFIPLLIGGFLAFLAILGVLSWLSSRGKFMLLDGIVRNHAAVREPWRRFRDLGNNLFRTAFALTLISLASLALAAGLGVALAWPDLRAERFGGSALTGLLVGGGLFLTVIVLIAIASLVLHDFVMPVMYLTGQSVGPAWKFVRREIVAGHVGVLVTYYLMRIVLGMAIGLIAVVAIFATCCIGALPYLSSVLLLPLIVFDRCYLLYFLQQFGPALVFLRPLGWPPLCGNCQYDLRANVSGICPECGSPIPSDQWAIIQQAAAAPLAMPIEPPPP